MKKHHRIFRTIQNIATAILLILTAMAGISQRVFAASSQTFKAPLQTYTAVENYLLEQIPVSGCCIIDLREEFTNEEDRVVSAEFLYQLLNGELVKIPSGGMDIEGMVVNDDLDLTYLEAPYDIRFEYSVFNGPVSFSFSHFNQLRLVGSTFNQGISFWRTRVDWDLTLDDAIITGPTEFGKTTIGDLSLYSTQFDDPATDAVVNFTGMDISGDVDAREVKFAIPADFSNIHVKGKLTASDGKFEKGFSANGATIEGDLDLSNTQFDDPGTNVVADFEGMDVSGDVVTNDATFAIPAEFTSIHVKGALMASGGKFEKEFSVNGAKIEDLFVCTDATFKGYVDAIALSVGSQIQCENAQFLSKTELADFVAVTAQTTFFDGAVFEGNADFSSSNFSYGVYFNDVTFKGSVDFTGTRFSEGDVQFENTKFLYPDAPAQFLRIQADEPILFQNITCAAGLDLSYSNLVDLQLTGEDGIPIEMASLDLGRARIEREFKLDNLILDNLLADSLTASGPATIGNVKVKNKIDFRNASFETISISAPGFEWPKDKDSFLLNGMTYKDIEVSGQGLSEETFGQLLMIFDRSSFSPQAYNALEQFLSSKGRSDWASKVNFQMKIRERQEILTPLSPGWLWSWFLFLFVGYGHYPYLAFIWSAVVVIIGSFVYYKESNMISLQKDEVKVAYNPLWYSFALFVPYIDLDAAEKWDPNPNRKWAYYYKYFHRILGWVLVPIALLTFSGIIQ